MAMLSGPTTATTARPKQKRGAGCFVMVATTNGGPCRCARRRICCCLSTCVPYHTHWFGTRRCMQCPLKWEHAASKVAWSKWSESVRKDVECVFGRLKARFRCLKLPCRFQTTVGTLPWLYRPGGSYPVPSRRCTVPSRRCTVPYRPSLHRTVLPLFRTVPSTAVP